MKVYFFVIIFLLFIGISLSYTKLKHSFNKPKTIETKIMKQIDDYVEQKIEEKVSFTDKEHLTLAELHHHGRYGRKKCAKTAINHYKESIRLSNEDSLKASAFFGLARLSEETNNGDQIIINYLKALECGKEESIIEIGKLYLNGLHPDYLPDKILAGRIFSTFVQFSDTLNPWCKLHLQQINDIHYQDLDAIPNRQINYKRFPLDIINSIHNATLKIETLIPYKQTFNTDWLRKYDDTPDDDLDEIQILEQIPVQAIRNDTQNVHDHSIQNIGIQIIDVLESKNKHNESDFNKNVKQLLDKTNHKKYPNVRTVCESLGDLNHSKYQKSEQDVFNLVWNRTIENSDLTVMFIDNINSSVEHEKVVCSTGKIMRMLSTLDVVDEDTPDLKPDWVIKEEITQTISKIIRDLKPNEKKQYDAENNDQIKEVIKDRIRTKCKSDYANVLDDKILASYLSNYLEYI
jgi:hypothetical protein